MADLKDMPSEELIKELRGKDTPEAWERRNKWQADGFTFAVLKSLAGVESKKAFDLRKEVLKSKTPDIAGLEASLEGVKGEEADELRNELNRLSGEAEMEREQGQKQEGRPDVPRRSTR